MYIFWGFLVILAGQRLVELTVARRHTALVMQEGGREIGRSHYKWIVLTHILFFVLLISEVTYLDYMISEWLAFWLATFLLTQALRYWAITSLGRHWNTRIIIVPGMTPIQRGPYRFYRHPNYVAIIIELLVVPLMFHAYITAITVSLINGIVLLQRIKIEEQAVYGETPQSAV